MVKEEERILDYWKQNDINRKVREQNREGKKFYFLDGPPFVSGDLHPGQMWVKTIKDIFLRYKRYRGFNVRDRAGFDVHGLPIENKVEKLLGIKSKKDIETQVGIEEFTKKCREFVDSYVSSMDRDYVRFGISMDFSDPYFPYTNEYMDTAWDMLKRMDKNGMLYSGKKTTAFCTHCGTAVSQGGAEIEYSDMDDPSIFVKFKVNREAGRTKVRLGDGDAYLLVWTTTPWTLPANVAVAAHPKEIYVLAGIGKDTFIVAKQRLDQVAAQLKESAVIKGEFYGAELAGMHYLSPIEEKVPMQAKLRGEHRVVMAPDVVSIGEGTGLVHIAPGHGLDDYNIGLKNSLPVVSPVAMDGSYTEEAGAYAGMRVPEEANAAVLKDMEANGSLVMKGSIRHSYPKCWRCKSKLVFIATKQWFLNVQKIKKKMISENRKVKWHPDDAKGWQESVIANAPDWCISRQRYWGIPMPVWECGKCGSYEVIGSLAELREKATDKRAAESIKDMHRPHVDSVKVPCPKCGNHMERIRDVIDVWFDSGVAYRASMTEKEFGQMFPIDYIIEGKDQLRGWFIAMLRTSLMAFGRRPYQHVAVDGMLLDEKGEEMHKSLGNFEPVSELPKAHGADAFRFWCAGHTPWLDMLFKKDEIKEAGRTMLLLYNVASLMEEYKDLVKVNLKPKKSFKAEGLSETDAWLLSRHEATVKAVTEALDRYEAFEAVGLLRQFVVEDFSRFYLKLAKKRITYGGRREAKAAIGLINYVFYRSLIMLSVVAPFAPESIYQRLYRGRESIFMERWPKANAKSINPALEREVRIARGAITALLNSREKAGISLRWPVLKATVEATSEEAYNAASKLSTVIADYANAKGIEVRRIENVKSEIRPAFAKLGPEFKDKAGAVAEALKNADAEEVMAAITSKGIYNLHTNVGTFDIRGEHFTVARVADEGDAALFDFGKAFVDRTISKELRDEALMREFSRRVQLARKELGLKKTNRIELGYFTEGEIADLVEAGRARMEKELGVARLERKIDEEALVKEFEIEDMPFRISVKQTPIRK